jgi:ribonuclease HIII
MEPRNSFTFELSEAQQVTLIQTLKDGNYLPATVPYSRIAVDGDHCRIVLYTSGKVVVQGKGAQDFVTFVLEPTVLGAAQLGYEAILNPEAIAPHIGVDESGKGDFFGPLVIAAAYTDESLSKTMQEMGVRDSKKITSDAKTLELARDIRKLLGNRFSLISIGPAKYNQLYTRIRSVNSLLAWGHARAIENLLEVVPACPRAVSDQFGSKEQVKRALMQKGRKIDLVQRHRAESDIAVAAASILAREGFLLGLRKLGETYALKLPKGASDLVQAAAVELVRQHTPAALLQAAKCHFKTTDTVLSRLSLDRGALGPDGAAQSRPVGPGGFRRHSTHEDATP